MRSSERNPRGALAAANSAVSRDPLSVEALFTLPPSSRSPTRRDSPARRSNERCACSHPTRRHGWRWGAIDLAREPAAAVKELQAAIYLDPQSISPEAFAEGQREAIEVHNDYIQALRNAQRGGAQKRERAALAEQQPPRAGQPGGAPHGDRLEAEVARSAP